MVFMAENEGRAHCFQL